MTNTETAGTIGRMAAYIVAARGKRAGDAARESALKRILDLLAAAGGGIDEPGVLAVRSTASRLLGAGAVPIWFAGITSSVTGAAWANSVAASTLDLDDGHRLARGHPGAAVIPTAFAVAAETGSGFEDLITAIVIGYEVGVTIAAARTAYGATGTWSSYAVVATAAALRGTPREIVEHALAIAGESAPNQLFVSAPAFSLPTPEGSDIKEGIPWSVVTGLFALDLAEGGFTGPRNVLESELYYRFSGARELGEHPHICNAYYKLYSCCRHIHPPLDAFLGLVEQHGIDVEAIEAIEIETYSGALRITNKTRPVSLIDVQYSIPYCLALAGLMGREALLPIGTDVLNHARIEALASRVSISLDAGMDQLFPAQTLARVSVVCRGQRYTSGIVAPRGEAGDALSWRELEDKFLSATRKTTREVQQKRLLAAFQATLAGCDFAPLNACVAESVKG